jgi:hypothetical protein
MLVELMQLPFWWIGNIWKSESATATSNASPRRPLKNVASYGHCKRECCRSRQGPSTFRLIFQSLVHLYLRSCFQRLSSHFSHTSTANYWVLFWKASSCSATQEILLIQRDPKVHYHVHRSPPLVPIRCQMNPVHTYIMSLKPILILSFQLRLGCGLCFQGISVYFT